MKAFLHAFAAWVIHIYIENPSPDNCQGFWAVIGFGPDYEAKAKLSLRVKLSRWSID